MKAAVFAGNGAIEIRDVPVPSVESADGVVLKVAANAICGTDVHALDVPPTVIFRPGVIIGHEFSGIVVDAGPNSGVSVGDRVGILPNVCSRGLPNLCILMEGFGSELLRKMRLLQSRTSQSVHPYGGIWERADRRRCSGIRMGARTNGLQAAGQAVYGTCLDRRAAQLRTERNDARWMASPQ